MNNIIFEGLLKSEKYNIFSTFKNFFLYFLFFLFIYNIKNFNLNFFIKLII